MFCHGTPADAEEVCEQQAVETGFVHEWFRQHEAYRIVPVMPYTLDGAEAAGRRVISAMSDTYMERSGQGFDAIVRDGRLSVETVLRGAKWLVDHDKAGYIVAPLDVPWGIYLR